MCTERRGKMIPKIRARSEWAGLLLSESDEKILGLPKILLRAGKERLNRTYGGSDQRAMDPISCSLPWFRLLEPSPLLHVPSLLPSPPILAFDTWLPAWTWQDKSQDSGRADRTEGKAEQRSRGEWALIKEARLGLPWKSSGLDSMLPMQGALVRPLVRELRSRVLHSVKIKKN